MKGLVIQLSPDAAQALRRCSLPRDGDDVDDWNDVIPLGRPSATLQQQSAAPATTANVEGGAEHGGEAAEEEEIGNGDDENDDNDDDDDESFMSRTPPSCLPTLLIDLERLVGYLPQTPDEVARLSDEVSEALGTAGDAAFEARVAEMLDANLARHATTRSEDEDPSSSSPPESSSLRYVNLPYPPALILEDGRHTVVTTARLWKRVIKPYRGGGADAVVNRLLDRLAHCSRPLTWKAAMRREVRALARREEMRVEMAEHEFHRSDQLRQLYGVRETIENQVHVTTVRVEELERERDELVRQRLALRRLEGGSEYQSEAMNFDIFSRGDEGEDVEEGIIPLSTDYSYEAESEDTSDNDSDSGESSEANVVSDDEGSELGESPSRESTMESTQASSASENVKHAVGRRRRRRRCGHNSREARRQREQHERASAEAVEAARVRREKEALQQQCTTPALASLQAVLQALERKLHQVDELLETLQEEEWKKEEERGDSDDDDDDDGASDPLQQKKQLSLLDEILAMILGATRPPLDNPSMDDHVAWLRNEHREIVKGWKDHFGRVPPSLRCEDYQRAVSSVGVNSGASMDSTTFESTGRPNLDRSAEPSVNEQDDPVLKDRLKQAFGIEDNDVDNWEEGEADELPEPKETAKALRPQRGRRSRR